MNVKVPDTATNQHCKTQPVKYELLLHFSRSYMTT